MNTAIPDEINAADRQNIGLSDEYLTIEQNSEINLQNDLNDRSEKLQNPNIIERIEKVRANDNFDLLCDKIKVIIDKDDFIKKMFDLTHSDTANSFAKSIKSIEDASLDVDEQLAKIQEIEQDPIMSEFLHELMTLTTNPTMDEINKIFADINQDPELGPLMNEVYDITSTEDCQDFVQGIVTAFSNEFSDL